jgi:polyisoprenoid-binding protein YceI
MKLHLVFLLTLLTSVAFGQAAYQIAGFSMTIKGTSNLHNWESNVKEIRSNATINLVDLDLKSIQALTVEIPAKTIKSSKGSMMDNKTYDALKADQYPNIYYKLDKINSLNKRGDGYDINATGSLSLAGVTKKIEMTVRSKVIVNGNVNFTGSSKIKMSNFNIKPPSALMGSVTTGDEVEVIFNVTLKRVQTL